MTEWLTEPEVAAKLKITERQAADWRLRYHWPHIKVGRQIRYTEADLAAIERIHHVAPEKASGLPGQTALSVARSK